MRYSRLINRYFPQNNLNAQKFQFAAIRSIPPQVHFFSVAGVTLGFVAGITLRLFIGDSIFALSLSLLTYFCTLYYLVKVNNKRFQRQNDAVNERIYFTKFSTLEATLNLLDDIKGEFSKLGIVYSGFFIDTSFSSKVDISPALEPIFQGSAVDLKERFTKNGGNFVSWIATFSHAEREQYYLYYLNSEKVFK